MTNDRSIAQSKHDDRRSDATDALRFLTFDLRTTLANLDGAPEAIANAVLQLLPFGSRAAMVTIGLAVQTQDSPEESCKSLELTPLGFHVIKAAAAANEAAPELVQDWMDKAAKVADVKAADVKRAEVKGAEVKGADDSKARHTILDRWF